MLRELHAEGFGEHFKPSMKAAKARKDDSINDPFVRTEHAISTWLS